MPNDKGLKVVAVIQARMGSTRLPGKVLEDLSGKTMLERVVSRIRRAVSLDDFVVATTNDPSDDVLEQLCDENDWNSYRGSVNDVLDRYYQTATKTGADVVVRITSDCPLIDPGLIDLVVDAFLVRFQEEQYVSNVIPRRTYPRGLDIEVFGFDSLYRAWKEDRNPATREHVTPYLYRNPEIFPVHNVVNPVDFSSHRWTVDTGADLELVRRIYSHFKNDRFTWEEALAACVLNPGWEDVNRHIEQKAV